MCPGLSLCLPSSVFLLLLLLLGEKVSFEIRNRLKSPSLKPVPSWIMEAPNRHIEIYCRMLSACCTHSVQSGIVLKVWMAVTFKFSHLSRHFMLGIVSTAIRTFARAQGSPWAKNKSWKNFDRSERKCTTGTSFSKWGGTFNSCHFPDVRNFILNPVTILTRDTQISSGTFQGVSVAIKRSSWHFIFLLSTYRIPSSTFEEVFV